MGIVNKNIAAAEWGVSDTDPADIETIAGANGDIKVIAFDDTTEEQVQVIIRLPDELDITGNVTFENFGFASAADGNEIQLRISHSAKAEGEDWDTAYVDADSGDKVTDGTQDDLDKLSFTVSIATLGWAAGDQIRIKLTRIAIDSGSKVVGDYYVTHSRIVLPTL